MFLHNALVTVFLIGIGSSATNAGVHIPLGAAMAHCAKQAAVYGQSLYGQGGETVDADRQEQFYRGCVRARSGQYPPQQTAKHGLRIYGSAAIGFVVK